MHTVAGRLQSMHVDGVKVELGGTFFSPTLNPTISALFEAAGVKSYSLITQLMGMDVLVWNTTGTLPFAALRHDPPGRFARDLADFMAKWSGDLGKTLKGATMFQKALLGTESSLLKQKRAVFRSLPDLLAIDGLGAFTNITTIQYLEEQHGVSATFISTILSAMTECIYAQKGATASAFNMMSEVSVIDHGVRTSVDGNQALVTALLRQCEAAGLCNVHVSTRVGTISKKGGGVAPMYTLTSVNGTKLGVYDAVVVASPIETANVDFIVGHAPLPAPRKFVKVYATVIRGHVSRSYFGGDTVLARDQCLIITPDASAAPFNMLWWRGQSNTTNESVYLLHSDNMLSNQTLDSMFSTRTYTYRKLWTHAFPVEAPRQPQQLPPIVLGTAASSRTNPTSSGSSSSSSSGGGGFSGTGNTTSQVFLLNSIESVGSSMETSALAARNVARWLLTNLV